MNDSTFRGTALSIDGTARPWMGRFHEWVRTHTIHLSNALSCILPSTFPSTLPSTLDSVHSQVHSIAHSKTGLAVRSHLRSHEVLSASYQVRLDAETRWVIGAGRGVASGVWRATEIMTSIDFMVWALSLARPLRQDLTMSHCHGVGNCSLRFCSKGSQLTLGRADLRLGFSGCPIPVDCGRRYMHVSSPGLLML
jgi:hypothetical protein